MRRPTPEAPRARTLYFVAMGGVVDRADAEWMLGALEVRGFRLVDTPREATLLVVFTSAFVEAARADAIERILDLAALKRRGRRWRSLVVAGPLVDGFGAELAEALPEVDAFFGAAAVLGLSAWVDRAFDLKPPDARERPIDCTPWPLDLPPEALPRALTTPVGTAFLKVSQGCSRGCAFCLVPTLGGPARSRALGALVEEAARLVARGVREITLTAEDLGRFGHDRDDGASLPRLIRALAGLEGLAWVRLERLYPDTVTDALLALWRDEPKLVPSVTLPLQHVSDRVLETFGVGHDRAIATLTIERLRQANPNIAIYATFIIGSPAEGEGEVEELARWLDAMKLEACEFYAYSSEEGTALAARGGVPPDEHVTQARIRRLEDRQRGVGSALRAARVGTECEVLVFGPSAETHLLLEARSAWQPPELGGVTYINEGEARPGAIVRVEIVDAGDEDLVAAVLP